MFSFLTVNRERAGEALNRGDYDSAVRQYRKLLKRSPNDHELLNDLGVALLESDRVEEALDCFLRANRLTENAIHHNNIGRAYLRLRDFPKAIASFEKAFNLDPDDPRPWFNLTVCYRLQKNHAKAREELKRFLLVYPSHPGARNDVALQFEAQGDKMVALSHLRRALESDAGYLPARLNLIRILCSMGKGEEATEHLNAMNDEGYDVRVIERNGTLILSLNEVVFYNGKAPQLQ